jgi:hypothetical protein
MTSSPPTQISPNKVSTTKLCRAINKSFLLTEDIKPPPARQTIQVNLRLGEWVELGWWVAGRLRGAGRMEGVVEEIVEMEGYVESVGVLENGSWCCKK